VTPDDEKIAELTEIIHAVRDRVRTRYPRPAEAAADGDKDAAIPAVRVPVADLMPIVHARDAAQAKIAAIGSVNPRAGGLFNKLIQLLKKTVSRALRWFVREQVVFNRETVAALEATVEALNEHNRILVSLASQTSEQLRFVRDEMAARVRELSAQIDVRAAELVSHVDARAAELVAHADQRAEETARGLELREDELRSRLLPVADQVDHLKAEAAELKGEAAQLKGETAELKDMRRHWIEWRADWERKLATNEIQFLRSAADLQGAFQHRSTQMESNFRDIVKAQHQDYLGALDRSTLDVQKRLWEDLQKVRGEYDRLIHTELRLIRQRTLVSPGALIEAAAAPAVPLLDYGRFAERFRGDEDYVRRNQAFYQPIFAGCANVLDVGCGRGEFLETMRAAGVSARGIDLGEESVAQCIQKGLAAERANLFEYLARQPDGEFDGIMSSQVVEHLAPEALPQMVRLCAAKLRRGGLIAVETPNPECLAIFATHFYLDPTHTRPVPHQLMAFYLEEAGFGQIEVHRLSPAIDSMPELAELPENFRNRFFGGLDYAIVATRL
jgi:O-antigen chain-terminating methyltransferase